ncbi:NUDIX hydrolase domain-like protein [Syncephalastrum racemosum]|uniref:NUDIX hydrolase domain-like protein n=1 Tax=Syncephalastrum racemosum TaxID=13706 RepID=A0A1X2HG58_SYNRA|nr:NUDIX hydrolase domain-like protein [Syncephalastrum racemosum]
MQPLGRALETQTLSLFSRRLLNVPKYKFVYQPQVREAAVLMALCNTHQGVPSVLFTIRNLNMRTHRGEVRQVDRQTGKRVDYPTDASLEDTARRETHEEVGLPPSAIDILGCYSPMPNRTGSLRVHPFLGFIRNPIDAADVRFNPEEVSSVFTLPIEYLIRPDVRQTRLFRNTKHSYTVFKVPDHIEGEREIWGLTSFILDGVFRKIIPEHYS